MLELLEIVKNVKINIDVKYDLKIENFFPEEESSEYHAHTFTLKNKNVLFKIAKKLQKKQVGL